MDFKIGDRVKTQNFGFGTVVGKVVDTYAVQMDETNYYDHDCDGLVLKGCGYGLWQYETSIELVEATNKDCEEKVMTDFKAGDRVEYTGDYTTDFIGKIGTVSHIEAEDDIYVVWDDDVVESKPCGVLNSSITLLARGKDPVAKPAHYNIGTIECIDYMKDNMPKEAFKGYLEGNAKKYMHRWRYKGKPLEDLKKARWYLDRLIGEMEND